MSKSSSTSSGFPVLSVLGLIFITLKLTGHITWSWLWVLAPFWIPLAAVAAILLVIGVVVLVKEMRS